MIKRCYHASGEPEPSFWRLFGPVRRELDRLFWCLPNRPWMGAPDEFAEDETATLPFEEEGATDLQLWRPGSLSRYADRFSEEHFELWGIEPAQHNPVEIAGLYRTALHQDREEILRRYAHVRLIYTDST